MRERTRGTKASHWRETIPLCLSLGAFAMSGFTFYDQYLRSEIDLWVQVSQMEIVYDIRGYFTRLETVIVNKGNVPAVVFEMSSVAAITDDRPQPGCEGRSGEAGWARVSIGSSTDWQRPRALSVKPNEPVALTADILLVGTPDDGVCLIVGYLTAAGTVQQAMLWVRQPLRLQQRVAISPELHRLRPDKVQVVRGKQ